MKLEGKILKLFISTSAAVCVLSSSAFAQCKGVVTGDSINIRAEANTNAAVVDVLNSGTEVAITNNQLQMLVWWHRQKVAIQLQL